MRLLEFLKTHLRSGHERSARIKKSIVASGSVKGASVLINLALVSVTLSILSAERYGVWITLSSVIAWFNFMDIGLGNGLRNKFAEALAEGDQARARSYVSTTYFTLAFMGLPF